MFSYRLVALVLAGAGTGADAGGKGANDACALRTALACEGGGYRAMAGCTGLTAGFLAAVGEGAAPASGASDKEGEGLGPLLGAVDLVAANSGGSWYAVSMLYSAEVPEMIEAMAAAPSEAADLYNGLWTDQTLAVSRRLGEVRQSVIDEVDPSYCPAILSAYAGVSFTDVIFDDFIGGPTSIPDTATLSMKPNSSWAEGKVLLLCSSLPTPGSAGVDGRVWLHFTQDSLGEVNGSISYKARSSRRGGAAPFPKWTPVKFSFRLGDGPDAAAPFPFCGDEDCNGLFLEYMGYSEESGDNYTAFSPGLGEIFNPFLVEGAGSLLIADVVSASNSVGGSAIISDVAEDGGVYPEDASSSADCVDLATWVDSDSFGNPFSSEDSEITEELIQETAASGLQGLVDGAWTDNTGVANSLGALTSAAGCAGPRKLSVTVMLTGEDVGDEFLALFDGYNMSWGPVCSSPSYLEVQEQMEASDALLPHFDASYLQSISYGTIRCETAENIWYGVKGGHQVDIHFLWIVTTLGTSPTSDDFYAHGTLAGEIVETMAYQNETVRHLAGQMLRLNTGSPGTSPPPADGTTLAETTPSSDASFAPAFLFPSLPLALALLLRSF